MDPNGGQIRISLHFLLSGHRNFCVEFFKQRHLRRILELGKVLPTLEIFLKFIETVFYRLMAFYVWVFHFGFVSFCHIFSCLMATS